MRTQNIALLAAKSIVVDVIGDVLYFPLWWYSAGLRYRLQRFVMSVTTMADQLALRLLVLNIFKPMFAQSDRAGRIISFFMRIVILIARSIYFFVFMLLQLLLIVFWVVVPIFVAVRIVEIYLSVYGF